MMFTTFHTVWTALCCVMFPEERLLRPIRMKKLCDEEMPPSIGRFDIVKQNYQKNSAILKLANTGSQLTKIIVGSYALHFAIWAPTKTSRQFEPEPLVKLKKMVHAKHIMTSKDDMKSLYDLITDSAIASQKDVLDLQIP